MRLVLNPYYQVLNPLVPGAHYDERQNKPFLYKFND